MEVDLTMVLLTTLALGAASYQFLVRNRNWNSSRWLLLFYVVLTADLVSETFIDVEANLESFPRLIFLPFCVHFFYGTVLYTYVKSLTERESTFRLIVRFSPTILVAAVKTSALFGLFQPPTWMVIVLTDESIVNFVIRYSYELVFAILALRQLRTLRKFIQQTFSTSAPFNYHNLSSFMHVMVSCLAVNFIDNIIGLSGFYDVHNWSDVSMSYYIFCGALLSWQTLKRNEAEFVSSRSTERQIKASHDVLFQALSESKKGVMITNKEREIVYVNESFLRMVEYSFKEVIGRKPSFLQGELTTPESIHQLRTALNRQEPVHAQIINYRKSGEVYLCDVSIQPVFSGNELLYFIALEEELEVLVAQGPKDQDMHTYHEMITLLTQEKSYTDPQLQLSDLAVRLNISPRKLSQVVNTCAKESFSDLINRYRVNEAVALFAEGRHQQLKINSIGELCGFNSKSAFYRSFKKVMGSTPTEYIGSLQQEELTVNR